MPNDNEGRFMGDKFQTLQDLLLLHPPTEMDEPAILSIRPTNWAEQHRVINIGPLLGTQPTIFGQSEDLERSVEIAFQVAGWPLHRITREFRTDFKNSTRIDVALLGETGQCLVAVEVKHNAGPNWRRRVRGAWAQLQDVAPNAPWHVVSDGVAFSVRNVATGEIMELDHAFGPDALKTGDFSLKPVDGSEAPTSFAEIQKLLTSTKTIILDHTIPIVRLDAMAKARALLQQDLCVPLPPMADLTQALLAWIVQQDHLTWVSAFSTAMLLSGASSQWIRDRVGSRFSVRSVIEFGNVFRDVHPAMRFCIVHLGKAKGPSYFASVSGDTSKRLDDCVRGATQFFAGEKPAPGFIADVHATGRWAMGLYDPELTKLEEQLAGIGPTKPLAEVCTIVRGVSLALHDKNANVGVPLVTRVAHIETPTSLPEDVRRVALTPDIERSLLRPGDVVMSSMRGGYQPCVLVRTDVPLVASDRLFVLRVNDAGIAPEFLVEYLNSALARRLLEERYAGSSGPTMLTTRALGSLPVPLLGRPVTLDLHEIGVVEAALRLRADELQLQRHTLFDAKSPQAFATAVKDLRRKGEVLSRSLLRANDLSFQVANFYPFPIAYGYRLLASISNPTDRYKEQLRVGENILAFIASVAMSLIQESDRASVGLDVREVWDGGASPGHWRDITGKCSKVLSTYKDHPLADSIVDLHITAEKRGFGSCAHRIIGAKNDFKHDRGPRTDEEFEAATQTFQQTLDECVKALAFFTDYPVRQVVDVDVERTGEVKLRCLAFVGDHPGLPQEEIIYRSPLRKRDLYIAAAGVGWVPLFPLIVARNCRSCKTRETFFLDKWNRKRGTATRKSFERGHEEETDEVPQHMTGWLNAVSPGEQ